MRGTSVGVHKPSSPACSSVGCSALLGHTFMHSPQRMQRERKSGSSSAPGGRSSRSWRLLPRPVLARISGTAAAPAASPVRVLRRPRSGEATSLFFAEEAERRVRAPGNCPRSSCTSGTRTCATARRRWDRRRPGSAAGSDCSCRRSPHPCAVPEPTSATPRPAARPAGKSTRHQKRVTRRLAARIARNRMPSTSPCAKCACRESSTSALQHRVNRLRRVALDRAHMALLERRQHRARGEVECRQNRQTDRPHQQAEGIEPANHHRSERRGHQAGDQHHIFDRLPALVAIRLDALLAALRLGRHVAHEVLQRAHGANPAAEEAAQKQRGQQNDQAPQQPAIESVAGQRVGQGNQRIPLEEQAHRRAQMDVARARRGSGAAT